jgi:L-fuculose-phosphate aldolase
MMTEEEEAVRQSIIDACLGMTAAGINQGTAGNISLRWQEGLLITPSGQPYETMQPEDIVFMEMDGSYDHRLKASSEWRFHRDIFEARPDINAVVHAHPIHATAFAMCNMEIPAVHYMIAAAGGPTIRCAPYASYGTPELSVCVLAALESRTCTLLANHGMIATGADLAQAMWLAVEVETLCRQYSIALQVGVPTILSDDEIERTVERFKNYGLARKPPAL